MTKLLPIIFMSILLSAEMEVDGDLKVTGTIQNDSLAQVILLQQQQISSLETLIAQLQAQMNNLLTNGDCNGADLGIQLVDVCGVCEGNSTNAENCPKYVLSFDGIDDYVDLGVLFSSEQNIGTISLLFKTLDDGVSFISQDAPGWNNLDLTFGVGNQNSGMGNANKLVFGTHGLGDNNNRFVQSISDVNDNEWHYASAVVTGSQYLLYLDGILEGSIDTDEGLWGANGDTNVYIGQNQDIIYYNGQIGNVQVWNIALSEQEIQTNMNSEITGYEAGLFGYWSSKLVTPNILYDYSGNENHGTIHGATWVETE